MSNEVRMTYDYEKAVLVCVKDEIPSYSRKIADCNSIAEAKEVLYELMELDDNITGAESGSYTFSNIEAERNLQGNRELILDALEGLGSTIEDYKEAIINPNFADVTIRIYLVRGAVDEALEDPNIRKFVQDSIRKTATSKNRKPARATAVKKRPVKRTATAKRTTSAARRGRR